MTMASSRVYAYATTRVHVYKYCGQVALDTVSATNGSRVSTATAYFITLLISPKPIVQNHWKTTIKIFWKISNFFRTRCSFIHTQHFLARRVPFVVSIEEHAKSMMTNNYYGESFCHSPVPTLEHPIEWRTRTQNVWTLTLQLMDGNEMRSVH